MRSTGNCGGLMLVCLCTALAACSSKISESDARSGQARLTSSGDAGAIVPGAGYVHNFSNSRFRIGQATASRSEFGFDKVVGSEGVFATFTTTGWTYASPNAGSAGSIAPPFAGTAAEHNGQVLAYFQQAGLPADQIGPVVAHGSMRGSGAADGTETTEPAGYSSIISRVVAGIPVPASFAWARINSNGDVIEESVYWPAIPPSVVSDATALAATLADPIQGPAFMSKLPRSLRPGQCVIVHSAPGSHTAFEVFAAYEATDVGAMARVHHFDSTGTELFLLIEKSQNLPTSARKR